MTNFIDREKAKHKSENNSSNININNLRQVTWSMKPPCSIENNSWPAKLLLIKAETAYNALLASSIKLDFPIFISIGSTPSSKTWKDWNEDKINILQSLSWLIMTPMHFKKQLPPTLIIRHHNLLRRMVQNIWTSKVLHIIKLFSKNAPN